MSIDWYQDIKDFHKEVMQDNFANFPHIPTHNFKQLRCNLIKEEIDETLKAIEDDNLPALADGIADSIVILLGTAVTYGIDMRPVWDIVHATNMAKKGGTMRADGKILKPEGWEPPNIRAEISRQQGMI